MAALEEIEAKIFDQKYPWQDIDRDLALSNTHVLDLVRESCLIESYFATYTGKMMELFWYDVRATSMYTIEALEAYTHFYMLRRYLATIGYRPVSDEEIRALREKDRGISYTDEVRELVNFMATEHFASNFFVDLSAESPEPVLASMLKKMGSEEVMHARFASDLLQERIESGKITKQEVLEHAKQFRHVGAYVLPRVSNLEKDNVKTIMGFATMIERITGTPFTEFMATP